MESGCPLCVGAFVRKLALIAGKMCSRVIYFIQTFYKSSTILSMRFTKAVLEKDAFLFNTKKVSFPSNFTGRNLG
jgi:hypothetical protein